MKQISTNIEKELLDKLKTYCEDKGVKIKWVVNRALEEFLGNGKK